jgi:mxaJ protein
VTPFVRTSIAVIALTAAGTASPAEWELRVCADPDNLPFSNAAGEGFDNHIAAILAGELGAELTYVWLPDTRGRTRRHFIQSGMCDVLMGVLDGQHGYLTSHAYYRTGYVFLYPEDSSVMVASLNDPALRDLRIGVPGGAARVVPPSVALANRGVVENQRHFRRQHRRGPQVRARY